MLHSTCFQGLKSLTYETYWGVAVKVLEPVLLGGLDIVGWKRPSVTNKKNQGKQALTYEFYFGAVKDSTSPGFKELTVLEDLKMGVGGGDKPVLHFFFFYLTFHRTCFEGKQSLTDDTYFGEAHVYIYIFLFVQDICMKKVELFPCITYNALGHKHQICPNTIVKNIQKKKRKWNILPMAL